MDVAADKLEPLKLGDSDKLTVGEAVVAIGSPFGLEETLTTGVVSALNREITAPNDFAIPGAIQTDAAINHGNSGGPLLNGAGQVVGMTSQIESESGGNDGIGFAVLEHACAGRGRAARRRPGRARVSRRLARDDSEGVAVTSVASSSPASEAGLKGGDVIVGYDGRVSSSAELRALVDAGSPGDSVTLKVLRDGKTIEVEAKLGTRPS